MSTLRGRAGKACALGMCTGPEWGESRVMGELSGIHVVRVVDGGQWREEAGGVAAGTSHLAPCRLDDGVCFASAVPLPGMWIRVLALWPPSWSWGWRPQLGRERVSWQEPGPLRTRWGWGWWGATDRFYKEQGDNQICTLERKGVCSVGRRARRRGRELKWGQVGDGAARGNTGGEKRKWLRFLWVMGGLALTWEPAGWASTLLTCRLSCPISSSSCRTLASRSATMARSWATRLLLRWASLLSCWSRWCWDTRVFSSCRLRLLRISWSCFSWSCGAGWEGGRGEPRLSIEKDKRRPATHPFLAPWEPNSRMLVFPWEGRILCLPSFNQVFLSSASFSLRSG